MEEFFSQPVGMFRPFIALFDHSDLEREKKIKKAMEGGETEYFNLGHPKVH